MEALTPNSLRAARAFLGWSIRDLQEKSGVTRRTIGEIEARDAPDRKPALIRAIRPATIAKLVDTFAAHGVAVIPAPADGVVRIPRA